MSSKFKISRKIPSYLNRSSKGGLLVGFIYVIAFMSILFLAIWQTFESENNKSDLESSKNIIFNNTAKIDELGLSSEDLISLKLSLTNIDTQLILLDDSVQALNNYKNQLNQVILEIQTQISSIENNISGEIINQN